MNKKAISKISAMLFAFAVVLSVSGLFFTSEVEAASVPSKPAMVYTIKAKTNGKGKLTVSWSKVKNANGYQLEYRTVGGKWVKCPRQKGRTVVFKAGKLKYKTNYQFRVRAYKTYKQKEYYNTKTKKWVTKKPAKENLGETRKVTKYRYGKYSKLIKIKTDKKVKKTTNQTNNTNQNAPIQKSGSFTIYLPKDGSGAKITINGYAHWRHPRYIKEDYDMIVDPGTVSATFTFFNPTIDDKGKPYSIVIRAFDTDRYYEGIPDENCNAVYEITILESKN